MTPFGTAPAPVDSSGGWSGRVSGAGQCLVLDGGQPSQAALPATVVVGVSIQVMIASRSSSWLVQRGRFRTFFCRNAKKD